MKLQVPTLVEKTITHIRVTIPDDYDGEDFGENFPFHERGQKCVLVIDLEDDGAKAKVRNWPADAGARELYTKVCDRGTYELFGGINLTLAVGANRIGRIEEKYVPHSIIPGEHGDYVHLKIAADGTITNWSKPDPDEVQEDFWPAE